VEDSLNDSRWVRLEAVDLDGVVRCKRMSADRFAATAEGTPISDIHFSMSIAQEYYDNTWGPWQTGVLGDVMLVPDRDTARAVPWEDGVVSVICDWHDIDGGPLAVAPRSVLRREVDALSALGVTARLALEYEFVLYAETAASAATKGWRNLTPAVAGKRPNDALRSAEQHALLGDVIDQIIAYGIPIEEVKVEAGSAQVEVNVAAAEPLQACDNAARLKLAIKERVARSGRLACFLARPPGAEFGSSAHVNVSLWQGGQSAFWDPDGDRHIGPRMMQAIGGLVATMRPLAPMFLPTVNSYRRLVDNAAAPVTVSWGHENKSVAVRTTSRTPGSIRIEHRLAGADANPYLAAAAVLAGIRHGLENEIEPPTPVETFAWGNRARGLEALPRTLREAVDVMDASDVPAKLLDPLFLSHFIATRRFELAQLDHAVTDWELARYTELI
jgi:glutamine synthetase